MVKNLSANARDIEMQVQSLGQEDTLEKGMGNLLQCSCLENPMDRGAWWAVVRTVTESSRLKQQHTCTLRDR